MFVRSATRARVRALTVGCASILGLAFFQGMPAANAVHDTSVFELDGNATRTVSDDWNEVCFQKTGSAATCGTNVGTNGASAVGWVSEPVLNSSIFTGGGSKDPQNLSNWLWKDEAGGLPDKDNLLHAYAARYSVAGDDVIYFGSDRYDNSGDAQTGFWFFQDAVATSGPKGSAFGFTGLHMNGDVLVVSDFSNGGATSTISVYTWDSGCAKAAAKPKAGDCGDVNLRLQETSNAANCASAGANDSFCGLVNPTNGTASPWSFKDKSGNTSFAQGEFYEGGINLSDIGLGDRCFSAFSSETRSSTSTTATLKDFVMGGFGNCGSSLTTQARNAADSADLTSVSIGTGLASAKDRATVSVTGKATWSGTVQFSLHGPVGPTATTVNVGSAVPVTQATSFPITSAAATVSSVGQYCWSAAFDSASQGVPDAVDDGTNECFTVNPVTPALDTSAGDDVVLGHAVSDTASLTGTATQPGTTVINGAAGPAAGGTIQFTLLKADCSTLATGTGTNPQSVSVSGDNASYGPVSFTPDATGTYHWKAVYTPASADPNNLGSTHNGSCDDTDETVVVNTIPTSLTSAQRYLPNDRVTVSADASGGGNLAGSVHFLGYESNDCSGTPIVDQTVNVSGASPQTVGTTNTTTFSTSSTISWKVDFTSTNGAHRSIGATCLEASSVTIDNGGTAHSG